MMSPGRRLFVWLVALGSCAPIRLETSDSRATAIVSSFGIMAFLLRLHVVENSTSRSRIYILPVAMRGATRSELDSGWASETMRRSFFMVGRQLGLAANQLLQVFGITGSLKRDLIGGGVDFAQVLRC